MKNLYILLSMATAFLLASCYDDKGGNDFDTPLPKVTITIPQGSYSGQLGDVISIMPTVKSEIGENDLSYYWEICGDIANSHGNSDFTSLLADEDQSRDLNYICHTDSNLTKINTAYKCRLRASQKSTGRNFYSNTFKITLVGVVGMMILHGNDNECNIGILQASDVMPKGFSAPDSPKSAAEIYSQNNGGEKIPGKGSYLYQPYGSYNSIAAETFPHHHIVVHTDKGVSLAGYADFSYYGDWSTLFMLKGSDALNANQPKGSFSYSNYIFGFDGDAMFLCEVYGNYPFLQPELTSSTVCTDGNTYILDPVLCASTKNNSICYANTINGDPSHNGFVKFTSPSIGNMYKRITLLNVTGKNFNPADMKAELIKMDRMGNGHIIAALKGKSDNREYAGKYFLADLYADASATSDIPAYLHDMSSCPGINDAQFWAFGNTINMCYYATKNTIYHYGIDGATLYAPTPLDMVDGSTLNITGQITMMKRLLCNNISFSDGNMMAVATWDGTNSTLWILHMDTASGRVNSYSKYNKDTVEGWNYEKIVDIYPKKM